MIDRAFWFGVRRGCMYGSGVAAVFAAVFAVYLAPLFLWVALAAIVAFGWMSYQVGRDDELWQEWIRRP